MTQLIVLDQEMVSLADRMVQLTPEELTPLLLQLCTLSRVELLARFQPNQLTKTEEKGQRAETENIAEKGRKAED